MSGHELLGLADQVVRGERACMRLTTTADRQPLPGYRGELLCVGAHGAVFQYSRAQCRRIARQLRLELAHETMDDPDVAADDGATV